MSWRRPGAGETYGMQPLPLHGMQPIPFCGADQPGSNLAAGGTVVLEQCLICCEERPQYAAVGRCGHADVCWICAVKLRSILKDNSCPVCKEDLPEVVLAQDAEDGLRIASRRNAGVSDGPVLQSDAKLGIVFSTAEIKAEFEHLFEYCCWIRDCPDMGKCFTTLDGLSRHLWSSHQKTFCTTCLYGRKVFLYEQLLYDPEDLDRHHREGDSLPQLGRRSPPIPAHTRCEFCKQHYYSKDELLSHMHKKHHLCGICERQGRRGEFYRDYGYLSQHYEEEHYVCTHSDCLRGPYKLVAFLTEDELRVHEITKHASQLPQKARKQAMRLNIQVGTASYADEQREQRARRQGATSTGAHRRSNAAEADDEQPVHFKWSRGKPAKATGTSKELRNEWAEALGNSNADSDEEQERYPTRTVSRFANAGRRRLPGHTATQTVPETSGSRGSLVGMQATEPGASGSRNTACDETSTPAVPLAAQAGASLLAAALHRLDGSALDQVDSLEQHAYKELNKQFKSSLQDVLGVEHLAEFKDVSAKFRRSLAEETETGNVPARHAALRTYAERVLEVFLAARDTVGESPTAELLSNLVALLPEKALRHSLHQELQALRTRKQMECAKAVAAAKTAARKQKQTEFPGLRADAPEFQPSRGCQISSPRAHMDSADEDWLPPKLEALGASEAYRDGGDRQPSFLVALDAVLRAVAPDHENAVSVRVSTISTQVKKLSIVQADSLEHMQGHLMAAGGANLDFGPMERLQALRPLLALKLQGRKDAGPPTPAKARGWREWKAAAASAVQALGDEERRCVRLYVRLCLRHAVGGEAAPAASGYAPAAAAPKAVPKNTPDSSGAAALAAEFPSLPGSSPVSATLAQTFRGSRPVAPGVSQQPQQDWPSLGAENDDSQQKKKKGGRQKQVLAAWG
eukprot:gnl/TRDRNA2_/TRDRNA2_151074_c0_seq1.p1 gnl/TRDRNA2_/TRDRNA2_151074_c0~~gnl/TRDRNA2_/TRDRNA2_151074_c0_seq1.p1  ORF type:complete len:916 (-),score=163.06 gnl/TRDRNA2_/TRDRNA2_151074_c0_seq1:241-2988(-)